MYFIFQTKSVREIPKSSQLITIQNHNPSPFCLASFCLFILSFPIYFLPDLLLFSFHLFKTKCLPGTDHESEGMLRRKYVAEKRFRLPHWELMRHGGLFLVLEMLKKTVMAHWQLKMYSSQKKKVPITKFMFSQRPMSRAKQN